MKKLLSIAILSLGISCIPEETLPQPCFTQDTGEINLEDYISAPKIVIDNATFYNNIEYGSSERNVYDMYIPDNSTYECGTPLVIYFHGGGYVAGDKMSPIVTYEDEIQDYIDNGFAVISANYTFIEENNPDQLGAFVSVNDGEKLIDSLFEIKKELNIDINNIALIGSSSGTGLCQYVATSKWSSSIRAISLNAMQATVDIIQYDEVFDIYDLDIVQFSIDTGLLQNTLNFHGANDLNELFSSPIVETRERLAFLDNINTYDGAVRIVAGNPGIPFGPPSSVDQLLHHQLHAIKTYNIVSINNDVTATIPYLNLVAINQTDWIASKLQ